jgi:hypothetical protein
MSVKEGQAVVRAWHDAVNRCDADAAVALAHEDVEVGGPRGSSRGASVLRGWVSNAGIQLEPLRWFSRDGDLVVEERATWPGAEAQRTEPQLVASAFRVEDGRLRRVIRHDTLDAALLATGLTLEDSMPAS